MSSLWFPGDLGLGNPVKYAIKQTSGTSRPCAIVIREKSQMKHLSSPLYVSS